MKIAVLYDIHGNLPALEAVLADVRQSAAERVVIGGDVVPGPLPRECLALLRSLDVPAEFIRGNGERVVLAARRREEINEVPEAFRDGVRWNAGQLTADDVDWVSTWPTTATLTLPGLGATLFCHATPHNDTDIFTRLTSDERLASIVSGVEAPLVICGHTHMQFERVAGATRIVNAGSVGMSFQGPGAYWLELSDQVRFRRTEYDLERAAERVRHSQFPRADEFATRNIMQPPTEDAMLKVFNP
jgi:predicted phosphodiesterase